MKRKFLLCTLALALILAGCSDERGLEPSPSTKILYIVSSLPKKGSGAYESKLMVQAIDLAIRERSAIARTKIEHLALDGGSEENGEWSPRIESANASLAANDPQVIAYIGPYTSGATGVALPITNKAHLLTLGPIVTWPGLTLDGWESGEPQKYYPSGSLNFARLALPDSRQGEAAAHWAATLGAKNVFALNDGGAYSSGLASAFVTSARALGLSVVGEASLAPGGEGNVTAKLQDSGADALFFAASNTSSAISLATFLDRIRMRINIFVPDTALNDQFLAATGGKADSWHFIFNGAEPLTAREKWINFSDSFTAAYGVKPSYVAARAYDLANLVLDAASATPTLDREQITRKVLATNRYEGASGRILFHEHGDLTASRLTGYRVENGHFVVDTVIEW